MNATQLDIFTPRPIAAIEDVAWLEKLLKEAAAWTSSRQCCLEAGLTATDDHRRRIRELASQSGWIISGQKGYKHLEHATPEEIHHAAAWLESQAKLMSERAGRIRKNSHRLLS